MPDNNSRERLASLPPDADAGALLTPAMASSTYRYDVFISYSTESDYQLARDLEGFLGQFHQLPTPNRISLKRLQIWRDETGRSSEVGASRPAIETMLTEYLGQCRHLLLLWSTRSQHSKWMRFEFDWFRSNRGTQSILLGITDAHDPGAEATGLFWPEMIDHGFHQRPWYDFRGFPEKMASGAIKLRDYEEARVQLAADLNGYSPAELQPIWWRNQVREQQEKAEKEASARRKIELAECDARLEASRGWYERAVGFFRDRRFWNASRCLLNAFTISSPDRVPEHYPTSLLKPGWCEEAWLFLRYSLALSPRLIRSLHTGRGDSPLPLSLADSINTPTTRWINGGRAVASILRKKTTGDPSSIAIPVNESPTLSDHSIWLLDDPTGRIWNEIRFPEDVGRITAWAASRHSYHVAVGTDEGWFCVWSGSNGRTTAHRGHTTPVTAIAFSHQGDCIATGCASGEVRIWSQIETGQALLECAMQAPREEKAATCREPCDDDTKAEDLAINYLAFLQEGASVLFRRGSKLMERRLDQPQASFVGASPVTKSFAHGEKGTRIAYADWDIVHSKDLESSEEHPDGPSESLLYVGHHQSFVKQVQFGADDRRLYTRDITGKVFVWAGREQELTRSQTMMEMKISQHFGKSNRGTLLKHLEGAGRVESLDPHPTVPDRVLIDRGGSVDEWDLGFAWEPAAGWHHSKKGSRCAAWLPDGNHLVAGADDGSIRLFQIGLTDPVRSLADKGAAIGFVAVSKSGALLATVAEDGVVSLRTLCDGKILAETRYPAIPLSVVFVGGERTLAVGYADGTVCLWDSEHETQPRRIGTVGEAALGLAATTDGNCLIACSTSDVTAWATKLEMELWSTSTLDRQAMGFDNAIGRLAISRNGQLVAYGCIDGTLKCREVTTGKLVSNILLPPSIPLKPEHVTAVEIADDNCTALAGLWDGTMCIVDLIRGRELFRFPAHSKVITFIAQAPNSGLVLTTSIDPDLGGDNQFVRVWNLIEHEFPLNPHDGTKWKSSNLLNAFWERYGGEVDLQRGDEGGTALEMSSDGTDTVDQISSENKPHEKESAPDFAMLRASLLAEPESAERNWDLARAYLSRNEGQKALDYLRRVCRLNRGDLIRNPDAACVLAEDMLLEGRIDDAIPWLNQAADQDNAQALLHLGLLSMSGKGMQRNEAAGAEFFRRSAEAGNAIAAHNLGFYHEHVDGGLLRQTNWRDIAFGEAATNPSGNLVRAFECYQKAAQAGYAPAQDRMGDFFAQGEVVNRDPASARIWYERAAAQGHETAKTKLLDLD